MNKLLQKLRSGLSRTRSSLVDGISAAVSGKVRIDDTTLEAIEERLIAADMGVETTLEIIEGLRQRLSHRHRDDASAVFTALKAEILERFETNGAETGDEPIDCGDHRPYIIMVTGVNGVGKTTTIGKLARRFMDQGKSVIVGAADTFRAAASEQLEIWAQRAGVEVIRNKPGADPAAVAFDTVAAAISRQTDVAIIDTAGRLHTKSNLMEELKKIRRAIDRKLPGAPHETLLVIDATTGQNGLVQAQQFHDAVALTGLVLTKLDGTAKGGIVLAIRDTLDLPVKYIGVGEQMDDLQPFSLHEYVEALFA